MNHIRKAVSAAALLSALAMPTAFAQGNGNGNGNNADASPIVPVGAFSATPAVVQTGTFPTLNWSIVYPSRVADVCVITPPGTITLTKQSYVDVRVVGVGVTECVASDETSNIAAEARISVNGSGYTQLFYGTNADVDPSHSLYTKRLNKGTVIDFGGRYDKSGSWSSFFTTKSSNVQMIALTDGDSIPTSFDLSQSGKMAEYLKPYVDSTGKVSIGPLSILVMGEYASTDHAQSCFDYQDFVLLVSLSGKNNNGHGNNLDGVDSSNPGQGSGGPTGANNNGGDPSGGVDDEIR